MKAAPAVRRVAWIWLALLLLMFASLGSAYLQLGWFNTVSGLVIAAIKAAIVVWLFMRLKTSSPLIRIVAAIGVVLWGVLASLSGVDYLTRLPERAVMQPPLQLPPIEAPGLRNAGIRPHHG